MTIVHCASGEMLHDRNPTAGGQGISTDRRPMGIVVE